MSRAVEEDAAVSVTRVELADHVEAAFVVGGATRSDLLEAARASQARIEVLTVLERLPDAEFRSLRDLWRDLPDVPYGE